MLVKRPIYNQQLKCVAVEIIATEDAKEHIELYKHFSIILHTTDEHLPLFLPYPLKFLLENVDEPIKNPIILKLNAREIDKSCSREELEASTHAIALQFDIPEHLAWLNFADYIALSDLLMSATNVTKVVKYSQDKHRKVIAYGIKQSDIFDRCKDMAIDYFCGAFLFEPHADAGKEMAADKLNLLELISKLQEEHIEIDPIIALIQADPILSFQLLKVTNSAAFSGVDPIDSIQQAVTRLGLDNLKNWITVISMNKISNKPVEIVESGLLRAQMAQKIAHTEPAICEQSAYTAGLLSVLDSLMDTPMSELIDQVSIAPEIQNALLSKKGPLGKLLETVIAIEEGRLDEIKKENAYQHADLSKIYIDCLEQVALSKKIKQDPT